VTVSSRVAGPVISVVDRKLCNAERGDAGMGDPPLGPCHSSLAWQPLIARQIPHPSFYGRRADRLPDGTYSGARTRGEITPSSSKHDRRSSATHELPQNIFACWRFSQSRSGAAISRTLALLNSAGTNFINILLNVKVRTE